MAFMTGSRAYGTPTEQSDVDLVVLMPREAELALRGALELPDYGPIRCGKLNPIVCNSEAQFAGWRYATDALIQQAPQNRIAAITFFQQVFAAIGQERFLNDPDDEKSGG